MDSNRTPVRPDFVFTKAEEVKNITARAPCPNCDEDARGKRLWCFYWGDMAVGICFNCECVYMRDCAP